MTAPLRVVPTEPLRALDAEQAIIGAVLNDPTVWTEQLEPAYLTEPAHRWLWEQIGELRTEHATGPEMLPMLISRSATVPAVQDLGGAIYLLDLIDKYPSGASIKPLAIELGRAWMARLRVKLVEGDDLSASADDWLEEQERRLQARWTNGGDRLPLIDPGAWEGQRAAARQWACHEWIPARQATYFTGAGSTGKSLAGQQLATCIALGRPFLGVDTRESVALYLTCEDDAVEMQRRQEAINEALDVSFAELSGRLHLSSLFGHTGNELATFDAANRMATTPAWGRLRAAVLELRPGLVCLDNVAHLFAGNEIIRNHVAAFCGLLNSLAAEADTAVVVFIGHPNKAGGEYSGSTAWENQVRSRIFLDRPRAEDGATIDLDLRVLSRGKSNYARNGERITFRWHRWAFVRDEDLPAGEADAVAAHMLARKQDEAFLACLAKATEEHRNVSSSRAARNYAPRLFATMKTGAGTTEIGFEAALDRLLHEGVIIDQQPVFRRANRTIVVGLAVAPNTSSGAPNPAPTMPQPLPQGAPTDFENPYERCT